MTSNRRNLIAEEAISNCPLPPQPRFAVACRRWLRAIVCSAFLMGGCVLLVGLVYSVILVPWQVSHRYRETSCVVRAGRLDLQSNDGDPEGGSIIGDEWSYRPDILIEYEVDGRRYRTWTYDSPPGGLHLHGGRPDAQAALDAFAVGHAYPCWYDPDAPSNAVLVRGYGHLWWLCFPWPFILVGGFGLVWLWRTRTAPSHARPLANPPHAHSLNNE